MVMLLVVDVGNTQTHVGLFSGRELTGSWRFATEREKTGDELAVMLEGLLSLDGLSTERVTGFAVASGVPRLNAEYAAMAASRLRVEALVIGPDTDTGMPLLVDDPRTVGADLIVQAVAARELYGAPCIVVGFGTATTFSAVSPAGEYLGHAIAPGIETSMDALATRAARLMKVELVDPGTVIGKNTVQAMQAGAVYGFAGQVDGVVARMRAELGVEAVTVATGGLSTLVFEHASSLNKLDPQLTLRGLQLVHERNHP
jgi:type III pantothenate kinase